MPQSVQLRLHLRSAGCSWGAGQQDGAEHLCSEMAALHVHHRADQLQRLTWPDTKGSVSRHITSHHITSHHSSCKLQPGQQSCYVDCMALVFVSQATSLAAVHLPRRITADCDLQCTSKHDHALQLLGCSLSSALCTCTLKRGCKETHVQH